MTAKDVRELWELFVQLHSTPYDRHQRDFMEQLLMENETHWKFMAWLKHLHPEVMEEWSALQDITKGN